MHGSHEQGKIYNSVTSFQEDRVADFGFRPQRYTLCITFQCNLACSYCYVSKNPSTMSLETAKQSIDFIFNHAPIDTNIEIGFFGGEPLLEFPLLTSITGLIKRHSLYDTERVSFAITTNGTIFSNKIAAFLREHAFKVCVSCDGPPNVQNLCRRTLTGEETAAQVERTLLEARLALPIVLVNAVYNTRTFRYLPVTLDYFSSLGLRHIFLSPDYSATWTRGDVEEIPEVYRAVAERYVNWYLDNSPHFVSLIDTKIAVLLRGGYHPAERCHMGTGELAITPDGGIYPCERLVGSGLDALHRIGTIEQGLDISRLACGQASGGELNTECKECSIKDYCMNWCGCTNAFMTGYYNRVGPFLCASERAAFETAVNVFTRLEREVGPAFLHHFSGYPQWNSMVK
jgi:uncharacterized protein